MRAMTMVAVVALALGCSNETGEPLVLCETNADCPAEYTRGCAGDGFCLKDCDADADCGGSQTCPLTDPLIPVCIWECETNADCPEPLFCGVWNLGAADPIRACRGPEE